MPVINPLLAGPLRRFRAIGADRVAAAMVAGGLADEPGKLVWHHDEILAASEELADRSTA
jgi:hypothetical protein